MSGVKGKGGPLTKSRSGSKLREQKSVSGLVTVEEEGKENLGPDVVNIFGKGKVEKDGVVEEEREAEREEWKGEVRLRNNLLLFKPWLQLFSCDTLHPLVSQGGTPFLHSFSPLSERLIYHFQGLTLR